MGFGKDFTEEELEQLAELDRIYDSLLPKRSSRDPRPGATNPAATHSFFASSSATGSLPPLRGVDASAATAGATQWHKAMQEINGEAVVRLGQNFRNTRTVVNRLLKWRVLFQQAERRTGALSYGGDTSRAFGQVWMRGIVQYFTDKLEKCFGELNTQQTEQDCIAPPALPPLRNNSNADRTELITAATADSEELVSRCISSARTIMSAQLSSSPYFIAAVRTCREMVQVLQMAQGLLNFLVTSSSGGGSGSNSSASGLDARRAAFVEFNFTDDYLGSLRTPQWLFRFIFLFLGAMNLFQDPNRDTTTLSGHQLDYAINCIARLVGEVDGKRRDGDVKATLDALVLGHVKNCCTSQFPSQDTLALLQQLQSDSVPGPHASDILTRCEPLLQQLLKRYPDFMSAITNFSRRNAIEEWGVSLMLVQLFCWDVHTPPLSHVSDFGAVRYTLPNTAELERDPDGLFHPIVLYAMTREVLRPLLSGLFSAASTSAGASGVDSGSTGAAVNLAAVNREASSRAGNGATSSSALSPTEQRLCAVLLSVVTWLQSVSFPSAARMTRWNSLDVGAQVMREFHLGKWCFTHALKEVLQSVVEAALRQIEAQVRQSAVAAGSGTPEETAANVAGPLLQYLLRVERVWHALTEHVIELDQSAFEVLRKMEATVLPRAVTTATSDVRAAEGNSIAGYETGLLVDCRYDFYDVVQACMKQKWPKLYADILTEPLLHGIHVFLLRTESAMQLGVGLRSGGAGGVPAASLTRGLVPTAPVHGARLAGVKRPPPPSGAVGSKGPMPRVRDGGVGSAIRGPPDATAVVAFTSKDDLHGALRLVRCIKNRDHFVHLFTISVRERLLTRPPPDTISDADLEKNKKMCEQEVEQFLASWLNDTTLLKTVRELHTNYAPQSAFFGPIAHAASPSGSAAGKDFKLATTILDWRLWGDSEAALDAAAARTAGSSNGTGASSATALPTTAAELRAAVEHANTTTSPASAGPTSTTAPLPFPRDAVPYLELVERRYTTDHSTRSLRWDWNDHVFTTFTLLYPKENGRVATVHGTLLLQRLFLAIAACGRSGIDLEALARRAGIEERRVYAVLRPCVERDRLLVRVGSSEDHPEFSPSSSSLVTQAAPSLASMRLALNYEWTRPPNRPRGDFTYWPSAERRRFTARGTDQDTTMAKRRNIIKTSIMQVMKQVQCIHHDELYRMVRDKNAKTFEVTVRNFKQEIEELIGKDFMARSETDVNEYVFRA